LICGTRGSSDPESKCRSAATLAGKMGLNQDRAGWGSTQLCFWVGKRLFTFRDASDDETH